MFRGIAILALIFFGMSCGQKTNSNQSDYFAPHEKGIQSGNVKMIAIESMGKQFNIWTKRVGNNPKVKILLLNGGPGGTHEYFQCFENELNLFITTNWVVETLITLTILLIGI